MLTKPRSTRLFGALTLALICSAAAHVSAQELTRPRNLVFSAERVFGFYLDKRNTEYDNGVDSDDDQTVIGIGWGPSQIGFLNTPRLGVDYFIDEHLTLGGNFGFASLSSEGFDTVGILLAGRVGYALRITNEIAFWPRGGLTFAVFTGDGDSNVFGLTLDGMFSLAVAGGWSFLAGPVFDLGFVGSSGNADYTEFLFGIMFGLEGHIEL